MTITPANAFHTLQTWTMSVRETISRLWTTLVGPDTNAAGLLAILLAGFAAHFVFESWFSWRKGRKTMER